MPNMMVADSGGSPVIPESLIEKQKKLVAQSMYELKEVCNELYKTLEKMPEYIYRLNQSWNTEGSKNVIPKIKNNYDDAIAIATNINNIASKLKNNITYSKEQHSERRYPGK